MTTDELLHLAQSAERLTAQSESWRQAAFAWQDWAGRILEGEQPDGGAWGDGPARSRIGSRMAQIIAARDEACDLLEEYIPDPGRHTCHDEHRQRCAALRLVGTVAT